jgi:hypothetical protein
MFSYFMSSSLAKGYDSGPNLEALTVNQVKSFKVLADGKDVFIGTKTGSGIFVYISSIKCAPCKTSSDWILSSSLAKGYDSGPPFSPLADLEYILRIRALIFHWLRLPVHVSNQKTFYTEHILSTKCKQRCHFPFWFQ